MSGPQASLKHAAAAFQDEDAAERYARAEAATMPFCETLVEKSGLKDLDTDAYVFDLATGTGAVVQKIHDAVPKEKWGNIKVLGGDISEPMLAALKARAEKSGWPNVETRVIDGNNLELKEPQFTHVFVAFGIFVMPDTLPKLTPLLKPGGFIGITTWVRMPWYDLLARSIAQIKDKPKVPTREELENFMYMGRRWQDTSFIESQLREAGCERVATQTQKVHAGVGNAAMFIDTMKFVNHILKGFWEEGKRDAWQKELQGILYQEAVKMAGGEDEPIYLDFEGIVGYGWAKA